VSGDLLVPASLGGPLGVFRGDGRGGSAAREIARARSGEAKAEKKTTVATKRAKTEADASAAKIIELELRVEAEKGARFPAETLAENVHVCCN
jgi:hypothetical protein